MRRVLALVLLLAFVGAAAAQPAPYDLATTDEVDVPDRTVTIEGTDYEIDAVSEVQPGDALTVDVAVGSGEDYYIDLYNAEERSETWTQGTGDGTQTFETDGLEPGTYALALEVDAKTRVVQPVVVSAYDLSLSAPGGAAPGELVTVTVGLDAALADGERVEVGVHGEGVERDLVASEAGDRRYEATVALDEPGTYQLYAAIRGQGQAAGYPVSTAISDGQTLSIDSNGGQDGDSDGGGTSGDTDDGDANDGGADDGDGGTVDEDGNASDDGAGDGGDGENDGTDPDGDSTGDDSTDDDDSKDDTDDGPVELNRSDDESGADAESQPVTLLVPLLGLLLALAVATRRARQDR